MYRTYSYNDMPEPVRRHREECPAPPPPSPVPEKRENKCESGKYKNNRKDGHSGGIFDNFETDDIILLVVALALLLDDCDDKLLLLALAFIFFSEWF